MSAPSRPRPQSRHGRPPRDGPPPHRPGEIDEAILYGAHPVIEALRNPNRRFRKLLATEQVQTTAIKGIVDSVRVGLVDDLVLSTTQAKRTGILRALPLPGEVRDTRTVTIADRLKASAALTAKASAVRIKSDVLRELLALI